MFSRNISNNTNQPTFRNPNSQQNPFTTAQGQQGNPFGNFVQQQFPSPQLSPFASNQQSPSPFGPNLQSQSPFGFNQHIQSTFASNQHSPRPFASNQQSSSPFASNQHSPSPFGSNQHSPSPFGSNQHSPSPFGSNQNSPSPFGSNQHSANPFGSNQHSPSPFGSNQHSPNPFGSYQHSPSPFASNPQSPNPFGSYQHSPSPFASNPQSPTSFGSNQHSPSPFASNPQSPTPFATNQHHFVNNQQSASPFVNYQQRPQQSIFPSIQHQQQQPLGQGPRTDKLPPTPFINVDGILIPDLRVTQANFRNFERARAQQCHAKLVSPDRFTSGNLSSTIGLKNRTELWLDRVNKIDEIRPSFVESSKIEFPERSYFEVMKTLHKFEEKHTNSGIPVLNPVSSWKRLDTSKMAVSRALESERQRAMRPECSSRRTLDDYGRRCFNPRERAVIQIPSSIAVVAPRRLGPPIRNDPASWSNLIRTSRSSGERQRSTNKPVPVSFGNHVVSHSRVRIQVSSVQNLDAVETPVQLRHEEVDQDDDNDNRNVIFQAIARRKRQSIGRDERSYINHSPGTGTPRQRSAAIQEYEPEITTILAPPRLSATTTPNIPQTINEEIEIPPSASPTTIEFPTFVPRSSRRSRSNRSQFKEHGPKLGIRSGVVLKNPEYFCKPTVTELDRLAQSFNECYVENFEIGHIDWGTVRFPEKINISSLDIDAAVSFERGKVTLYPKESKLQNVDLCDCIAIVTYEKLDLKGSLTGEQYIQILKEHCASTHTEFISYDPEEQRFKFKINGARRCYKKSESTLT